MHIFRDVRILISNAVTIAQTMSHLESDDRVLRVEIPFFLIKKTFLRQ